MKLDGTTNGHEWTRILERNQKPKTMKKNIKSRLIYLRESEAIVIRSGCPLYPEMTRKKHPTNPDLENISITDEQRIAIHEWRKENTLLINYGQLAKQVAQAICRKTAIIDNGDYWGGVKVGFHLKLELVGGIHDGLLVEYLDLGSDWAYKDCK
jgi:hypothetical protein